MKKIFFSLLTMICLLGIIVTPDKGFAFMTALSETDMRSTIAQVGIAISTVGEVSLNTEIESIAYGSAGINGDPGAWLGFNDLILMGTVTSDRPVSVAVTTEPSPYTGIVGAGVNITLKEVEIDIERFEIGSIIVGPKPGEGPSFGRIIIKDYHAIISGDIRITTH